MLHWNLQFTMRIAFRCVLHRWASQDIHCWKFFIFVNRLNDAALPNWNEGKLQLQYLYHNNNKGEFAVGWQNFAKFKRLNSFIWHTMGSIPPSEKPYRNPWHAHPYIENQPKSGFPSGGRLSTAPHIWMCEWSFRRFTYGNRVTTFASFRGLYLRNFPTSHETRQVSPSSSQDPPIGCSDGRCVQRAGT